MADRNASEVYAHHRRLAEYSEMLEATRKNLRETYPHLAKAGGLLESVAQTDTYAEWRRHRCHDHSTVWPGAKMPDGELGFAIYFYEGPDDKPSMLRGVHVTRTELEELVSQAKDALEAAI